MIRYRFTEAQPLINMIEENKTKLIGHKLKELLLHYWPRENRCSIDDEPVIFILDHICIAVEYYFPSDMDLTIGSLQEFQQERDFANTLTLKEYLKDYYGEEPTGDGIKKELIEDRTIRRIEVQRFSEEFECYSPKSIMRPQGGDYFSTIRIYLDSGKVFCFRGADSRLDRYIEFWCEDEKEDES